MQTIILLPSRIPVTPFPKTTCLAETSHTSRRTEMNLQTPWKHEKSEVEIPNGTPPHTRFMQQRDGD